jgi:type I restriction enzyme S subunit
MKNDWQVTPLAKCLSKVIDYRGRTPKKLGGDWAIEGYRALSANNVKFSGLDKLDSVNFVDENLYKKWMKDEVKRGDLLLTSEAPSGQVMVWDSDEKIVLSQRLYALRTAPEICNKFLKYYLQSPAGQKEIFRNNSGSTVSGISAKTFTNILIRHPEKSCQEEIGETLYLLDQKINLNNRINAELNAITKALYDYWFVQFDFPDANGKPYKSSGGKMIYAPNLKREIPAGWESGPLSDWIGHDKTGDWGKDSIEDNYTLQVNCIRGTDINSLNGSGELTAPTRTILEKNRNKILEPFDFVIEISGGSPTQSTGRIAIILPETIDRFSRPIICSNFCKAISLKDNTYFFNFFNEWLSAYDNGVLLGWEGKTSGIKNLLFDAFVSKYFVCKPPQILARTFFDFVNPLQIKKQKLLLENDELGALRDWLLPMFMNGQVKVT